MKRFLPLVILIALPVAGCGVFGGGPSPEAALAFRVPNPSSLTYVVGDTADIKIETGMMGTLEITTSSSATLGMDFASAAGGVQVTAEYQEYSARQTNPMAGTTTSDQDDLTGLLVFNLSRGGDVEITQAPQVAASGGQFYPEQYAYLLFPGLPGRAVDPGESWVDTVTYVVEGRGGSITTTTASTYTFQGDTTVAGRNLMNIGAVGALTVEMTMTMEGMDIGQAFAGEIAGTILWDPAVGLLYFSEMTRTASGTVDVPAAGMPPMPLTVSGTFKATLQG